MIQKYTWSERIRGIILFFVMCLMFAWCVHPKEVYASDLLSEDGCYRYQIIDEEETMIGITEVLPGAIDSSGGCVIPNKIDGYNVRMLADGLFEPNDEEDYRYQLKAIEIPEGITEIPRYCFFHCENLMSVHFPSTLTTIQSNAFNSCISLEEIQFPLSVVNFYSGAFWYTPWLFEQRNVRADHLVIVNNVVVDGRACEGDVVIPKGVVEIAQTAFYGPEHIHSGLDLKGASLKSITMADSVTCVGSVSFYGCEQLSKVTFSDAVDYIGLQAFYGCTALKEIQLPKNIRTVKGTAFQGTKDLVVVIPAEVTNLSGLNVLELAKDVKFCVYKGSVAQSYLAGSGIDCDVIDTNTSTDPDTPDNPSNGDSAPTATPAAKGKTLTSKSKKCKVRVTSSSKENPTVAYVKSTNTKATTVTVPDTVKINNVTYKVTSVADKAFYGNKKIKTVNIGKNVTSIGKNAFKNCTKLKSVVIGSKVKLIGERAFYKCSNLKKIIFKSKVMKRIGKQAFRGVPSKAVVTVPKNMKSKYRKLLNKAK